jgi:hypothetical protein
MSSTGVFDKSIPMPAGTDLSATQAPEMYAAAIITAVAGTLAVFLRFYARIKLGNPIGIDDWLIVCALVRELRLCARHPRPSVDQESDRSSLGAQPPAFSSVRRTKLTLIGHYLTSCRYCGWYGQTCLDPHSPPVQRSMAGKQSATQSAALEQSLTFSEFVRICQYICRGGVLHEDVHCVLLQASLWLREAPLDSSDDCSDVSGTQRTYEDHLKRRRRSQLGYRSLSSLSSSTPANQWTTSGRYGDPHRSLQPSSAKLLHSNIAIPPPKEHASTSPTSSLRTEFG